MTSGVYHILNTLNGKRYIGSSVDIEKRWRNHLYMLKNGIHHNLHLQRAFNKYGENVFAFEILEIAKKDECIQREQSYLDSIVPKYNFCPTAGSPLGYKHTPETRHKIGEILRGRKKPPRSDEHRHRISEAKMGERNPMYGKHPSEETKRKMSAAHKKRWIQRRQAANNILKTTLEE